VGEELAIVFDNQVHGLHDFGDKVKRQDELEHLFAGCLALEGNGRVVVCYVLALNLLHHPGSDDQVV